MKWSPEAIVDAFERNGRNIKATARELGIDRNTVRKHVRAETNYTPKPGRPQGAKKNTTIPEYLGEEVQKEFNKEGAVITTKSLNIKTLEEALEAAEVNLEEWKVERFLINSWEVTMGKQATNTGSPETYTNWQVKVWLKPLIVEPMETAIRELIKTIPKLKTPKFKPTVLDTTYALEICPYDAHFGKLAWGRETQQGDYDIEIAGRWFLQAISRNIEFAQPFNISKIFYILGQDLMHVENIWGVTPLAQNRLDMDTRLPKIYRKAKECTLQTIYMLMEIAPVEVLWIPGNHDIHASYFMSEVVKEHFKDCDRVFVDNSPPWRKARLWGNLLVGYAHDASGRMGAVTVNMLAQFWPELWGQSKFREFHTGHKHKKAETKYMPTQTIGGVLVRQIPTLSTIDAWHYQEGFVDAVPAGESFLWSKDNGICAHYTAYVGG